MAVVCLRCGFVFLLWTDCLETFCLLVYRSISSSSWVTRDWTNSASLTNFNRAKMSILNWPQQFEDAWIVYNAGINTCLSLQFRCFFSVTQSAWIQLLVTSAANFKVAWTWLTLFVDVWRRNCCFSSLVAQASSDVNLMIIVKIASNFNLQILAGYCKSSVFFNIFWFSVCSCCCGISLAQLQVEIIENKLILSELCWYSSWPVWWLLWYMFSHCSWRRYFTSYTCLLANILIALSSSQ